MHNRRKTDKLWKQKPDWLKSAAEKEAEKEALKNAEALLKQCAANLIKIKDKYEELDARLAELDALLKK